MHRPGQPLGERPHVLRDPRAHRRRARLVAGVLPAAAAQPPPQRPHAPAEVIGVVAEVADQPVRLPVLAEAVGPPRPAGVAVAVGGVVPLQERGVDRGADRRVPKAWAWAAGVFSLGRWGPAGAGARTPAAAPWRRRRTRRWSPAAGPGPATAP